MVDSHDFKAVPGQGIQAVIEGQSILIGTAYFMQKEGIALDTFKDRLEALEAEGKTTVIMTVVDRPAALLGIADRIKEDSPQAVAMLQKMGFGHRRGEPFIPERHRQTGDMPEPSAEFSRHSRGFAFVTAHVDRQADDDAGEDHQVGNRLEFGVGAKGMDEPVCADGNR